MTKTLSLKAGALTAVVILLGALALFSYASADSTATDFESFTLGTVNAQDGWTSTGAAGSGCAIYDHAVVSNSYGFAEFGSKVLRISNAVTSGCFGDMTFSKSLIDESGEVDSTSGGMSGGTRQAHFEAQFDFASTESTQQPGLFVSVSPDRGDGSRMSYLGFSDELGGIDVIFYDTPGTGNPATFSPTTVATGLSRDTTHTAKFVIDYVDGASNDVVKIYIDGVLEHTGTTWENYFRFDSEASAEQSPRTTDDLIFRTGGGAAPDTAGKGFLFDNVSLMSGPTPPSTVTVTINKYINGAQATAVSADSSAFPMSATWSATNIGAGSGSYDLDADGFNGDPTPYQAITSEMTSGADYSTYEITGGAVVGADCSTGQPYALVGYSAGDTPVGAEGAPVSLTVPSFTGLTGDKYVIVWNKMCVPTPVHLSPADDSTLTSAALDKIDWTDVTDPALPMTYLYQSSNSSATNLDGSFTTPVYTSGPLAVSEIPTPGTPEGVYYWHVRAVDNDGNMSPWTDAWKVTVDNTPPAPPSLAEACETPGVAPAGYTLQNGTAGHDKVVLASMTMFVGLGGNDKVDAGDGNYIICLGAGNDKVTLGDGEAVVDAGAGNDKVIVGDGGGTLISMFGNNTIIAGDGGYTVTTGAGNDKITTGSGADTIDAGDGNNKVNAGGGDDSIMALGGNDKINGQGGTDTCSAGGGFNVLTSCEL